jgi:hypothetical protein
MMHASSHISCSATWQAKRELFMIYSFQPSSWQPSNIQASQPANASHGIYLIWP